MPEPPWPARWFLPTLGAVLAIASYAFVLSIRAGALFSGDGDVGRHIRVGTEILTNRAIPRVDVFSHTLAGTPFVPYEWLSEVLFALANRTAGLVGVALLTTLLFTGTVVTVYSIMRRCGLPSFLAFVFALWSLLLQATHLLPRPHLFTTLLVSAFVLILLEVRSGRSRRGRLLALPALMLLWANLHGGFLLGFIVLVLFVGDSFLRAMRSGDPEVQAVLKGFVGTGVLCLVATFLTPAGWHLWPHTTGYLRLDYLVDVTQEYQSPDFHQPLTGFFLVALLYGAGILALLRSRVDPLGLASFVLFAAFGLHSGRNIPIFGVVVLPWLALWTRDVLAQAGEARDAIGGRFLRWSRAMTRTEAPLLGWPTAVLVCAALSVRALMPGQRDAYRFDEEKFPVAAVASLERPASMGRVFNDFIWGGYLLYAAWPDVPVFIDGQTDFYGEDLTREFNRIRYVEPGWRDLLDRYGVTWALIPPDVPLAAALALAPDWRLTYSDSTAVIFRRHARP